MIKLKNIINESFFKGFEANRVGKSNWTEIFKNPTSKEIKECTSDGEIGVVLWDNDVYVFNRDNALHVEVMRHINPDFQDLLPMMVSFFGNTVGIYVTDAACKTKWYRQPKTEPYIRNHPFFKGKKIDDVTYWDEDVNGKWVEESIINESLPLDTYNKKDTYGHWINPNGAPTEVNHSHELTAVAIIKTMFKEKTISDDEYYALNIPLNSTSEVEDFLYNRGWVRGVIDGRYDYYVNGTKKQSLTPEQIRWLRQHGKDTRRSVHWCPLGEGVIVNLKTIYSPYDLMEDKKSKNPRLGKCYELTGRYVSYHPDSVLVHGTLINPFVKGLKKLDHAWVELANGEVFDPVMDKIWPKGVYEGLFKTKVDKKYTHDEVIKIIDQHENWGPWNEVVMEVTRDEERGKSLPETGYAHKHVEIFRAMLASESHLKYNDYVTRTKRFAIEHSDHMTSVHETLYHVMRYIVKAENVFEAHNPGEYFYYGPSVDGTEIYNSEEFL